MIPGAVCEHSGSRVHVMELDGTCRYCRRPLVLVALDGRCPACGEPRPGEVPGDPGMFESGSVCPSCGHVERVAPQALTCTP